MASVSPHSFRHILLTRILLLLMPLLGISEWLVLHQARRSLLDNAHQQAQEVAKSRAVTLELRQLELIGSSETTNPCKPSLNHSSATSPLNRCDYQSIIQRSLDNVLIRPFVTNQNASVPVLAMFGPQGELLGHSAMESSFPSQAKTCSPNPTCELMGQLTSTNFPLTPPSNDRPGQPNPHLILNGQWIIASHSVRLAPFGPTPDGAMPPEQAPSLGQIVVAIPTSRILAPLKSLTHWMFGATFALTGISIAVALYLSRELARPVERLRDRLLAVQRQLTAAERQLTAAECNTPDSPPPQARKRFLFNKPSDKPFKIQEFQQLAGAFNQLIDCLNHRSAALEQATQEAYATSQLKSDFLAATSHELRTPLNALIGHIQLIQDGYCDDAEEEAACLSQANQAALHLLKVLNELLDIARIEAGKFEFEHQQFELSELLTEVLEMERSHLIQKGLAFKEQLPTGNSNASHYWVQADRDKLKQVILNIISNAIKFTDNGSINIALQTLNALEGIVAHPSEPTVVLSITDTGIGIDQHQRQRLFRPFARASQASRPPYEGSGLGLAISRTLMERMGGSIRLYSPGLGQGTTVEIHLPLHPSPLSPKAMPIKPAVHPHSKTDSSHSTP